MGKIYANTVDNETDAATIITAATNDSITFTRSAIYIAGGHNAHVLRLNRITTVAIDGQLYSDDGSTVFGLAAGATDTIRVGATGVISSNTNTALSVTTGASLTLYNKGEISGRTGVLSGTDTTSVINDGTIVGTANGLNISSRQSTITNHGSIAGHTNGLYLSGGNAGQQVTNSGDIAGHAGAGLYVLAAGDEQVTNTGTIAGRIGVEMLSYVATDAGERTFANHGTVTGTFAAFFGSDAVDHVRNDGSLVGAVYLNGGADSYDGSHGTVAGTVFGGDGNDELIGGSARNVLSGGTGDDVLIGGAGDDILIPGTGADYLDGGDGRDIISFRDATTGVIFELDPNVHKTQTLVSIEGIEGSSGDDNLTGDLNVNWLYGRDGNDTLQAFGDGDFLIGGKGDDIYYADVSYLSNTHIIEEAGAGYDTVYGYGGNSYLPANAEKLVLYGGAAEFGLGNDLANTLVGNANDNFLDGGLGNDMLTGGGGQDNFLFDDIVSIDTVTDFDSNDTIYLSTAAFNLPPDLALSSAEYYVGTAAHDSDDRIIFNPSTHALYYDPDGIGGAAQIQFAIINGSDVPTASDIIAANP